MVQEGVGSVTPPKVIADGSQMTHTALIYSRAVYLMHLHTMESMVGHLSTLVWLR